jgi:hypothetical protein
MRSDPLSCPFIETSQDFARQAGDRVPQCRRVSIMSESPAQYARLIGSLASTMP